MIKIMKEVSYKTKKYYETLLQKYGGNFKGMNWSTKKS